MENRKVIGALIGLVGAVENNGKTERTDEVVRRALLSEDNEEILQLIHEEKYALSPSCRTCKSPCGNTSDFNLTGAATGPAETNALKEELTETLIRAAEGTEPLPMAVYQGIAYLKYDLKPESYRRMITQLGGTPREA